MPANYAQGPGDELLEILEVVEDAAQPVLPPLRMPARAAAVSLPPVRTPKRRRTIGAFEATENAAAIGGLVCLIAVTAATIGATYYYGFLGFVIVLAISTFVCRMVCFVSSLVQMMRYGAALIAAATIVITPICCCGGMFVPMLFGPGSKVGGWQGDCAMLGNLR